MKNDYLSYNYKYLNSEFKINIPSNLFNKDVILGFIW